MQRIDGRTASPTLPTPAAVSGTPGYFTDGDPQTATPPTTCTGDFLNMLQEELMAPVLAAGITPSKTDHGQLLEALQVLFVSAGGSGGVHIGTNQISLPLPGGFVLKAGKVALGSGANVVQGSIAFDTPFPNTLWAMVGSATSPANGSWHPILIMFDSPSVNGSPYTADSCNVGQAIAAGNSFTWFALGR